PSSVVWSSEFWSPESVEQAAKRRVEEQIRARNMRLRRIKKILIQRRFVTRLERYPLKKESDSRRQSGICLLHCLGRVAWLRMWSWLQIPCCNSPRPNGLINMLVNCWSLAGLRVIVSDFRIWMREDVPKISRWNCT